MTYRELLTLYKTGQLDPETREQARKDIERQDAIGEYLFDEGDIPALTDETGGELPHTEDNPEFLGLIQKSIRRAFVKLGAAVCAVVLVLVLAVIFVLPRAVDLFFYDPAEVVGVSEEGGRETERMSLELAVWTELFAPSDYRDQVQATPRGYGRYDLIFSSGTSYNWDFKATGGSLVRNHLTLYDPNAIHTPTGNAFVYPGEEEYGVYQSREHAYAAVDELEEGVYYQGYISLDEALPYEDFLDWYEGLPTDLEAHDLWCLVDDRTDRGRSGRFLGVIPYPGGYVWNWDREKYPLLSLIGDADSDARSEEDMRTHFLSMVRYLGDHPEIGEMLGERIDPYFVEYLTEHIEKQGIRIYGFSVIGQKELFAHLREEELVNYIYAVPSR